MLTVTGLWFDHERTPVGLDHTPVFGWQLEGNCRNIRQTQYRLQVALTPDFAALLYDETCETGNSTAVHAAGLTLQSLQKYYARVQVWADTAAGPQQTLWSEPAVFITALLDPAAEWKAEFVSAESPETCRKSSAGTMVRAAFTVKPGLRAAYACTTALGLYNVYLNGQKVSTDEMTPGWTSYNRRLLYQTYEVTAMLHPGLNMAGAMLGAGWYKGVMGLTRSRNNYGDTTAFAMQLTLVYADGTRDILRDLPRRSIRCRAGTAPLGRMRNAGKHPRRPLARRAHRAVPCRQTGRPGRRQGMRAAAHPGAAGVYRAGWQHSGGFWPEHGGPGGNYRAGYSRAGG